MSESKNNTQEPPEYRDFISYQPEPVKYFSSEQLEQISNHKKLIGELRHKNMTAKEIHQLFYDAEEDKYSITLKTVYKRLEKLEKKGFITVSGHRMTEGSRQTEKLYSRTANVFFLDINVDKSEKDLQEMSEYANKLNIIISELLEKQIVEENLFNDFYLQFSTLQDEIMVEILEKTKTNEQIADIINGLEIKKLSELNNEVSALIIFLRHPEFLEKLQDVYRKDK